MEILKAHHIRFQAHHHVGRYEIDFLIGRVALEVDGPVHRQTNAVKDAYLVKAGYVPIHVSSTMANSSAVANEIITLIRNNNSNVNNPY